MATIEVKSSDGDFTIFGFVRDPEFLHRFFPVRLGINPQTIAIGSLGHFFYYSSYGDFAESEEAIVFKLGFLRSTTKSALNAKQLLEQKLVGPGAINTNAFSGNGLVVGISKTEPVFSVFQTLMAVPQLHYYRSSDGILCSDAMRWIINLIPNRKLNEAIIPQHFLFHSVYGQATYIQGVERLLPGQYLKWENGNIDIKLTRKLDSILSESHYIRDDARALNLLYKSLLDVVGDYITQVKIDKQQHATLLSGGVDSTLLQFFINAKTLQKPLRSISYSIQVPAFEFEIEYARQASDLLDTQHTFVTYTPQDYPGLLLRTIDILSQPPNLQTEPSILAIAEFVHGANWPERYYFTALAADSLFGEKESLKLKGLHWFENLPYAIPMLRRMGGMLTPITSQSEMLIRWAEILESKNDPNSYTSPANLFHVFVYGSDWEVVRRSFGDHTLREALAYRRNLAAQYSSSQHYLDKIHFIDLFTGTYEITLQRQQLFLAHHLFQIDPFSDEDILKVAMTFSPDLRYIKGFRYKHLLKRLLAQKTKAPVAHQRKGGSTTPIEFNEWMRSGPLRSLVEDIQRPSFMDKTDFEGVVKRSNYFLWTLLTFDLFLKRVLNTRTLTGR